MNLLSIATATPPHSFTQIETYHAIRSHPSFPHLKPRSASLLEKILTNTSSGISSRQFAVPDLRAVFPLDAESLNKSFERNAPALASRALAKALARAGLDSTSLDALFLCTCTGYLCPGPSSHVAEISGLRPDAFLCDLVGLGCGAAIPTLRAAHGYLAANPTHRVAMIAVEVSSSAFFIDDDPGVLISLCLFGDGAAATILTGGKARENSWSFHNFDTIHIPEEREKIRFINSGGKLKNQLHPTVPELAAQAVSVLHNRSGLSSSPILAHSGGRDVIDAIEAIIPSRTLPQTRAVLSRHGNMSSPSVLFALADFLETPSQDDSAWLTAFGAGFAAHSCQISR